MPTKPEVRIVPTTTDLFHAAANEFASLAQQAVKNNGKFTVALSGGSTPKGLYSLLASGSIAGIPWDKVFFFFGDERHVPPDHADSNYRMVRETGLLAKVPEKNVFRVPAETPDADAAAQAYEQTMWKFFGTPPNQFPRFDLILLGLGPDGHTASLFPGTAALTENQRPVVAVWVEKFQTHRITLTLPVINDAACVMFLVSGADKANTVREVFENKAANLPAQKVIPQEGRLLWLLDQAAAAKLRPGNT
jgi:6-phosphogluconolactonase